MNERIRELVGRAEAYAYEHEEHWHDGPDWQELFNKKFAELIVRECADLFEVEWGEEKLTGNDVGYVVKKHFGVE